MSAVRSAARRPLVVVVDGRHKRIAEMFGIVVLISFEQAVLSFCSTWVDRKEMKELTFGLHLAGNGGRLSGFQLHVLEADHECGGRSFPFDSMRSTHKDVVVVFGAESVARRAAQFGVHFFDLDSGRAAGRLRIERVADGQQAARAHESVLIVGFHRVGAEVAHLNVRDLQSVGSGQRGCDLNRRE